MGKYEIISRLQNINIPSDKYIVVMGAVLSVNGGRDATDIDILFDTGIQNNLENSGFSLDSHLKNVTLGKRYVSGEIEAFDNFFHIGTFEECLKKYKVEMVEGVPFMTLKDTIKIKSFFGREKDLQDMASTKGRWNSKLFLSTRKSMFFV